MATNESTRKADITAQEREVFVQPERTEIAQDKNSYSKRCNFKSIATFLLIGLLGGVITTWYYYNGVVHELYLGDRLKFNDVSLNIYVRSQDGHTLKVAGDMGMTVRHKIPSECSAHEDSGRRVCLGWDGDTELQILYTNYAEEAATVDCYNVSWRFPSRKSAVIDCFNVTHGDSWYGGGESRDQVWPIRGRTSDDRFVSFAEKADTLGEPMITGNPLANDYFGSVVERYWLTSNGVAIYVDDSAPLFVWADASTVCLVARHETPYLRNKGAGTESFLNYTVCGGDDVKQVHEHMTRHYIVRGRTQQLPDLYTVRHPLWMVHVDQLHPVHSRSFEKKLVFSDFVADLMRRPVYNGSVVVIDDGWEHVYGDYDFDPNRFTDPEAQLRKLSLSGYKTGLFVHPFANVDSKAFIEGIHKHYWIRDGGGKVVGLSKWVHGAAAAALDTTNPESVAWFVKRMKALSKRFNLSLLDVGHGEVSWLPYNAKFHVPLPNPGGYSQKYAQMAANIGSMNEVHVGARTQHLAVYVSSDMRTCTWSGNGLRTVIPGLLTLSLIGYNLAIGDSIGGTDCPPPGSATPENGTWYLSESKLEQFYGSSGHDRGTPRRLTSELFVRWLQIMVFSPVVRFTRPPWLVEVSGNVSVAETEAITERLLGFRNTIVLPVLENAMLMLPYRSEPIIQPMWWVDSNDPVNFKINDQFILAGHFLVAPVLYEGKLSRDVYIPRGKWIDPRSGQTLVGPRWMRNYTTPFSEIPYFTKV